MDPVSAFGVAAGAAQFADLAANVFLGLFKYVQSVKQAPKLSHELQREAYFVSIVLKDLKSTLEAMKNQDITKSKEALNDIVLEFSKTLIDMERRVNIKESE